ncbi:GFA family protein [Phenylobacterium terrae]|uniref:GFA family protein n=1 Tax=Phenylobacterium terrae TaxID=2665495 RepID=A0ABW4N3J2_9CAUL
MREPSPRRIAACGCGQLEVAVSGEPRRVYACSCAECQRATGSAFAYRAVFPEEAVAVLKGEGRTWRRGSDAGRWVEQTFCPDCGALLLMRGEGLAGAVAVSVGSFVDPDFPAPEAIHRPARRHRWLALGVPEAG